MDVRGLAAGRDNVERGVVVAVPENNKGPGSRSVTVRFDGSPGREAVVATMHLQPESDFDAGKLEIAPRPEPPARRPDLDLEALIGVKASALSAKWVAVEVRQPIGPSKVVNAEGTTGCPHYRDLLVYGIGGRCHCSKAGCDRTYSLRNTPACHVFFLDSKGVIDLKTVYLVNMCDKHNKEYSEAIELRPGTLICRIPGCGCARLPARWVAQARVEG